MVPPHSFSPRFRIDKPRIRRVFYLGSLSGLVLLALALSLVYTRSLTQEFDTKIEQLSHGLIEEKKRFMRNAVERTIDAIEYERRRTLAEYADQDLAPEELDAITRQRVADMIRETRLIDNGYLWVNQIIDWNGGDGYAIRVVHPNLPDTEGMKLSTDTEDIRGNRPYAAELEGMKEHGELFFEYYFKKMGSDEIAHKMSFAKLYAPYDWVVATGVYLDDVDRLIEEELAQMRASFTSQLTTTLAISGVLVLLSMTIIVIFERQLSRLILAYEGTIEEYTNSLEELSNTDRLTGLHNRLRLDEVFRYEINQARRYGTVFSILLLDLDRFKEVNDTYGHQAGDTVLKQVATILRRNTRKTDTVGRWGGEEFLLILPESDAAAAMTLGEKIRRTVAAHAFPAVGKVTCSIGVAAFRPDDTKETMTERADKALYCAKHGGRDKVECEGDLTS